MSGQGKGNYKNGRGLQNASPEKRIEIARMGGSSLTFEDYSAAGKIGGARVAKNRDHMAAIGRKGGQVTKAMRAARKAASESEGLK